MSAACLDPNAAIRHLTSSSSNNSVASSVESVPMITPTSSCESQQSRSTTTGSSSMSAGRRKDPTVRIRTTITNTASSTRKKPTVVTPSRGPRIKITTPISIPLNSLTEIPPGHHMIYLIRHGQSRAQTVTSKAQRLEDASLVDCGLTLVGQQQALQLTQTYNLPPMDLVLSSPLTRALQTATLAFPETPILVHYELRELGKAPENCPRPWDQVAPDLPATALPRIDHESLRPPHWPHQHNLTPTVIRRNHHIPKVFPWLATSTLLLLAAANANHHSKGQQRIAIVCHFHVIRAALARDGFCPHSIRPDNGIPIPCLLTPQGKLILLLE